MFVTCMSSVDELWVRQLTVGLFLVRHLTVGLCLISLPGGWRERCPLQTVLMLGSTERAKAGFQPRTSGGALPGYVKRLEKWSILSGCHRWRSLAWIGSSYATGTHLLYHILPSSGFRSRSVHSASSKSERGRSRGVVSVDHCPGRSSRIISASDCSGRSSRVVPNAECPGRSCGIVSNS